MEIWVKMMGVSREPVQSIHSKCWGVVSDIIPYVRTSNIQSIGVGFPFSSINIMNFRPSLR
jgi:hypothetical protein